MYLLDILSRQVPPDPWAEGDTIPWDDPGFSVRMLKEHLNQEHDAASRRFAIIDQQVAWIHNALLKNRPARILDLGCGPGLYTSRFAKLGHACVGIDFSPASVEYAREQAAAGKLARTYHQGDIRTTAFGEGYGLVMLIFGELNVFKPADARLILERRKQR